MSQHFYTRKVASQIDKIVLILHLDTTASKKRLQRKLRDHPEIIFSFLQFTIYRYV